MLCLEPTKKLCTHKLQASFDNQIQQIKAAWFLDSLVTLVTETFLRKVKVQGVPQERLVPAVIPFVHKVTQNLKKAGTHCLFWPRQGGSTLLENHSWEDRLTNLWQEIRPNLWEICHRGGLWNSPYSKSYIGQTGHCINERTMEHNLNLMKNGKPQLPVHCKAISKSFSVEVRLTDSM